MKIIPAILIFSCVSNSCFSQSSLNKYNYEYAVVTKRLGDLYFLSDSVDKAKSNYEIARKTLSHVAADDVISLDYLTLLIKEIEYRETLLANNLPFWGLRSKLTVKNPVSAFLSLKENIAQLNKVYHDIEAYESASTTANSQGIIAQAQIDWHNYQEAVAEKDEDKHQMTAEFYDANRLEINARLQNLRTSQIELTNTANSNFEQIKENEKTIGDLSIKLLTSTIGFDLNLDSQIKAALESEVTNFLSTAGPGVLQSLKEASSAINDLSLVIYKADSIVTKLRKEGKDLEQFANGIRSEYTKKLRDVGNSILATIPAQQIEEIEKEIREKAPLQLIIDKFSQDGDIKTIFHHEIQSIPKLSHIPANFANEYLTSELKKSYPSMNDLRDITNDIFNKGLSHLPREKSKEIIDELIAVYIGIKGAELGPRPDVSKSFFKGSIVTHSKEDATQKALVTAGLSYFNPALGIVAQMVDAWAHMGAKIDLQKTLTAELTQLIEKEVELEETSRNITLVSSFAKLDAEIQRYMAKASNSQQKIYYRLASLQNDAVNENRGKIVLRLGYFYYLADQCRRSYFELDESLDKWFNTSAEKLILKNPQNFHYILDSDILLGTWLQSAKSTNRINLDSIKVGWDRIETLLNINCPMCKATNFNNVQQTTVIKLSDLVSNEEWTKFRSWQQSGETSKYKLYFDIKPTDSLIDYQHENARLININIGAIVKNGNSLEPVPVFNQFSLDNTGTSFIRNKQDYKVEVLAPKPHSTFSTGYTVPPDNAIGSNLWPSLFDVNQEATRWSSDDGRTIKPFEGYGLYSSWFLSLTRTPLNRRIHDIYFRFSYQFEGLSDIEEEYYAIVSTKEGVQIKVNCTVCDDKTDSIFSVLQNKLNTVLNIEQFEQVIMKTK